MSGILTKVENYDSESGELLNSYDFYRGDTTALDEWKSERLSPFKFKEGYRFTKTYHTIMPPYENKAYLGHFYVLIRNLQPYLNCVSLRKYKGGDEGWLPVDKKGMEELLQLSRKSVATFLEDSITKGIMAEVTVKFKDKSKTLYVINPIYAFNGNRLDVYLYEIFKDCPKFKACLQSEEIEWYTDKLKFVLDDNDTLTKVKGTDNQSGSLCPQ